ncbi:MAG: response regulator [Blastocatellia bacterium]|nr:response regulator [Blastocatellia bacterium]
MEEKIRVLVIDDEPTVADALRVILSDRGYEVVVALNGRDGLKQVDSQAFDFAITDLRLPDLSGFDVLDRIRKKRSGTPVIVITAYSTPEVVERLMNNGAMDVLPKPFLPSDVLNLIDEALSKK